MKKLVDILRDIPITKSRGSLDVSIASVEFDSRKITDASLFVATKGTQVDGHNFIEKAIELGAQAIVCEEFPNTISSHICYIKVKNSHNALGQIASRWYDEPSKKMTLVGVTGTNGKTTIATMLYELYSSLGYSVGLISTIENRIGQDVFPSTHTTPDALSINSLMGKMVENGCSHCFMEVSSHALHQGRTSGLDFDGAIFTNLTHDHLDYHIDFASYLKAKKIFFDTLKKDAFALSNMDDKNGLVMLQNCQAQQKTYSIQSIGDFTARIIENQINGLNLNMAGHDVWFRLNGRFNAYNLLAIYGAAILLGEDSEDVLSILSNIKAVNGRFEQIISPDGKVAIVDYAHTPDALLNVLKTLKDLKQVNAKLICVVGAGGNRDKSKRPEMAAIAATYSNQLILTSDNPRFEDPESIIQDMKSGLSHTQSMHTLAISNREEAIKTAVMMAEAGDFILIAGKGHENYQEIKGVKHHFDDKELINQLLNKE